QDASAGLFAMEYLDPSLFPVWKEQLRDGNADPATAEAVAERLVMIHNATAGDPQIARMFGSDDDFTAIRLEPYLLTAAEAHPDLAAPLKFLVQETLGMKLALVHGDVSPKNILCGPDGPVFLDAECAWYGDPAFDLAFCLNHLLLKCLWVPASRAAFLECYDALSDSYLKTFADIGLEDRAASLLPALLLARVDGKSPVEYLTEERQKHHVRKVARQLVARPPVRLKEIRDTWRRSLT